ncbi:MarR family winged helix-turn-helix transcriptional regulator [Nocardioides sp.]|uniref:MarR family winged helix-turn-helix transcriptional regulator n=1 Tax=Nocardioides sp. TaxID=35761 RepID=UPI002ED15693
MRQERSVGPSRSESLRQIEHEVGALIRRVRRVIGDRARAVHPDLQPATYLLLTHLDESGPQRASDLVDATGVDKGAISRQVQLLVDLGLLTRTQDPDDGRATLLAVTDDARARLRQVQRERRRRFDRRLGAWSDDDLAHFASQLAEYNAALD